MRRRLLSENERVSVVELNDFQTFMHQAFLDHQLHKMFVDSVTKVPIADGKTAYLADGLEPNWQSGNREVGMVFRLSAGVGLRNETTLETDEDLPQIKPMIATTFIDASALDASHLTNNRKDRIYAKFTAIDEVNVSRDFIEPTTEVVSSSLTDTVQRYAIVTAVAKGADDGSETAPAAPAGYTDDDAVAEIFVRFGSGTFDSADLTDMRDKLIPNVAHLAASMVSALDDAGAASTIQAVLDAHGDRVNISFNGTAESGYILFTVTGGDNWALAYLFDAVVDHDDVLTLPVTYNSTSDYTAVTGEEDSPASHPGIARTSTSTVTVDTAAINGRILTLWTFGKL